MGLEFQDRRKVLFGREPDLAYLLDRARQKGMTAVVGRAQMGKSWLLTELARRLSQNGSSVGARTLQSLNLLEGPSYLVGSTECLGETADLLLRTVVDLYTRWLSDSTYSEQAQVVWQQQKKDIVSKAGEAFGTLFEKLSKLGAKPVEAVGGFVKGTFEALANTNRELLTGGVQIPRLQIEEGRDLLALVTQITNRSMVLVFDQWEKSPGIELEANVLDSFLRHLEEWPACHIFLGLRPDEKPLAAVKKLHDDFPGPVEVYELPPMHLDESASRVALITSLKEQFSAAAGKLGDDELIDTIAGFPGTLYRWQIAADPINSPEQLKALAKDANSYRFREFDVLLPALCDGERLLGMRLALLPATGRAETWKALYPVMLNGVQGKDLDGLKRKRVLESSPPPSYGHAKRSEAALNWFTKENYEELREVSESLIVRLGSRVRDTSSPMLPFVNNLVALHPIAARLELSSLAQALCQIGLSLFQIQNADPGTLVSAADQAEKDKTRAPVASLLAIGLFNALGVARREGAAELHDAILEQLRQLAHAYPQDACVRSELAKGLFNARSVSQQRGASERRDSLLNELRDLARAHPGDSAVREHLAQALLNTMVDMKGALEQCDMLLAELRKLTRDHPQDAAVRNELARGLSNALYFAKQDRTFNRRDAFLDELRQLARVYSESGAVREVLAEGLFTTLNDANVPRSRREALLDELRQLAREHREDAVVRAVLAKALFNRLNNAIQEGEGEWPALLDELQQLVQAHRKDEIMLEILLKIPNLLNRF